MHVCGYIYMIQHRYLYIHKYKPGIHVLSICTCMHVSRPRYLCDNFTAHAGQVEGQQTFLIDIPI